MGLLDVFLKEKKVLSFGIPLPGHWGRGAEDGAVEGCGQGSFSTPTLRNPCTRFVEIPGLSHPRAFSAAGPECAAGTLVWEIPLMLKSTSSYKSPTESVRRGTSTGAARSRKGEGTQVQRDQHALRPSLPPAHHQAPALRPLPTCTQPRRTFAKRFSNGSTHY